MNTRFSGFRYTHEAVGALVLVTVLIFVMALLQAGRMRQWFDPAATVRVILPAEGVFGLTEGARVEILGTKAGDVRRACRYGASTRSDCIARARQPSKPVHTTLAHRD